MPGETDLTQLLQTLRPELNAGEYVFCLVESDEHASSLKPVCSFLEKEGITVILPRENADAHHLPYSAVFVWITLTVHSSLEAVGLTAAVSQALTGGHISCNVVAAYYHDHIFVLVHDAERAMQILSSLSQG
ncbi:MAG TPA: ACT domain-containing protein [Anaerolineales bacterium]|nr:ACT domain-containing protein [Anaerolineales bacterium]HNN14049.1 ACT domain-containing protein [Anaerolineales bacterium]HNO30150.1 ACT domain-containing protein [Anaerolineales bacterium]